MAKRAAPGASRRGESAWRRTYTYTRGDTIEPDRMLQITHAAGVHQRVELGGAEMPFVPEQDAAVADAPQVGQVVLDDDTAQQPSHRGECQRGADLHRRSPRLTQPGGR